METETKPGVKTSEFWLAFAVTVMGAIASVSDSPVAQVSGLVAAALASAGYGLSRGRAKAGV